MRNPAERRRQQRLNAELAVVAEHAHRKWDDPAADALILSRPAREAAAELGRSYKAVFSRRTRLRQQPKCL